MKRIYFVAEDLMTELVLDKILVYLNYDYEIIQKLPCRGGQLKADINKYNKLAEKHTVVVLTDLDNLNCPIELLDDYFYGIEKSDNLIFNIAYNEVENWLMSDRVGLSSFLKIPLNSIPEAECIDNRKVENIEIKLQYKSSLFLMRELASLSRSKEIIEQLKPKLLAKKGPEYNSCLSKFVVNQWDIDAALTNSYSLKKAIVRLENLFLNNY